jgi:hypothetical protein
MNIKHLLAASVVAVAPFAFAQKANAAASDCWYGDTNDRALEYAECDVTLYERYDGEPYFIVELGVESIKVFLWTEWDGRPEDRAEIVTTNTRTGKVSEGNYPYAMDSDGDPGIEIGDFRLVFRFPDHPDAGTGNTQLDPDRPGRVPVSPGVTPTDGLQPGDLSNTPFRF